MKCAKYIFTITVLTLMSSILIVDCSSLSRKIKSKSALNTKAAICAFVKFGKTGKVEAIDNDKAVFPQDFQKGKALENAKKQMTAAREVFYKPGPKIKALIKSLAEALASIIVGEEKDSAEFMSLISTYGTDANRQISNSNNPEDNSVGSWFVANFTPGVSIQDFIKNQFAILKEHQNLATPVDIIGFLGLIGDVAACTQDVYGRKDKDKTKVAIANIIKNKKFVSNLETISEAAYKNGSPDIFYPHPDLKKEPDNALYKKGLKPLERATCMKNLNGDKLTPVRSGLFDLGAEVDAAMKIDEKIKIPFIQWPLQTVPKKLIDSCKDEAWAGHFSGSAYELLHIFDVLTKKDSTAEVKAGDDDRRTKAALASAFLIATGFHSAVEINYSMQNYYNGKIFKSISDSGVCSTATAEITKLILDQNK